MFRKLLLGLLALATASTLAIAPATADIHPRPTWTDTIVAQPGSTGSVVSTLQKRLAGIGYLHQTATGRYDAATTTAVKSFQSARKLTVTGVVDDITDKAISSTYTWAQTQIVLAPGMTSAAVKDAQLRLANLGYLAVKSATGTYGSLTTTAVTKFQVSRNLPQTGKLDKVSLNLLKLVAPASTGVAAGILDRRCLTGHTMCIDKTTRKLYWVVDGSVKKIMDARFGALSTPTREGQFAVYYKDRDHVSGLYGSAMPFSMFFSGGQAVHYSSDFAARGYLGASHGCVNIRDYSGIAWLFDQVKIGDKVVVYWS